MLWYKGWLETRLKLAFTLVMIVVVLELWHSAASPSTAQARQKALSLVGISIPTFVVAVCAMLAGTGINTPGALRATRGLHGSTLYTLSMPVTRLRLMLVRASLGWLGMAASAAFFCFAAWWAFPVVSGTMTASEMLEYSALLLAYSSVVYSLSVLLGTVLDEMWRVWGTMLAAGGLAWLSSQGMVPQFADIFRVVGQGGQVIAHTVPWAPVGFAVGLSAALLYAAYKVGQAREY